mmetsp:Transcript_55529/g.159681  ORF Transcript_55529/g.159681 Transcript_55529/m.159681 type:complete len:484 (-) Transcript_55529:89-1540(-)
MAGLQDEVTRGLLNSTPEPSPASSPVPGGTGTSPLFAAPPPALPIGSLAPAAVAAAPVPPTPAQDFAAATQQLLAGAQARDLHAATQLLLGSPSGGTQPAAAAPSVAPQVVGAATPPAAASSPVAAAEDLAARTLKLLGDTKAPASGDLAAQTAQLLGSTVSTQPPAGQTPMTSTAVATAAITTATTASAAAAQDSATQQLLGGVGSATQVAPQSDLLAATERLMLGTSTPAAIPAPTQGGDMSRRSQDQAATRLLGSTDGGRSLASLPEREQRRPTSVGAGAARGEAQATCFRMAVTGQIESAQMGAGGGGPLMCVFSVQHGADWSIVSGVPNGITQLACSSVPPPASAAAALVGGGLREVVWNFPLGLVFKSTSPFGWPRLVVTVYGTDMCNRRVIKGYGSVHVPCQPGRHQRTIRLYCPLSSSPFTRLLGALFGNPAQLVDPRLVAGAEGREVVRVQSGGKVRVVFDVLLKDTEAFNYSF